MNDVEPTGMDAAVPLSAVRAMWSTAARGWERHAAFVDRRGAGVTDEMLTRTDPRPGDRVLELACGPGGVGLAAASRVGSAGHVVLSDLVEEMTATASSRAQELGLTNVSTRELDLQRIDEPAAHYDVVVCREALMLVPDPAAAVAEMARVLRPGGRVAVAVWGPRARNTWLGALFDAVTDVTGLPVPPPGVPGPFSLDDTDALYRLFTGAGLADVAVAEVEEPLELGSLDEWWEVVPSLAGPLASLVASLDPDVAAAIRGRGQQALEPFATPDGYRVPGVSLVASGRRP